MTATQTRTSGNSDSILQTALEQAKGQISQAEKAIHDKAEYAAVETERYIRRRPWAALAVAGTVGVLVGLLLTRR